MLVPTKLSRWYRALLRHLGLGGVVVLGSFSVTVWALPAGAQTESVPEASLTALEPPAGVAPGGWAQPHDINNHGQVVGEYQDATNPYGNNAPFLWEDGQATKLPLVGDMGNRATRINDRGQVVLEPSGGYLPDDGEVGDPALWEDGATTAIPSGRPVDLNENGEVLLELAEDTGTGAGIWRDGDLSRRISPPWGGNRLSPKALSDTGIVVGDATYTFNILDVPITVWRDAFVWRSGSFTRFQLEGDFSAIEVNRSGQAIIRVPDGTGLNRPEEPLGLLANGSDRIDLGMAPRDINDRGQVVGQKDGRAYLWEDGQLTELGGLGGDSRADGINEHGQIIGRSRTSDGELHGVAWSSGHTLDLGPALPADINDLGQVVGRVTDPASGEYAGAIWQIHDDNIAYEEPGDPGDPPEPDPEPECFSATNSEHVAAGRATSLLWFVWAAGSDQYIGQTTDTTVLKETTSGSWELVDTC